MTDIAANLASLRARMALVCERAGRPADAVRLLAVSKGQPPDAVKAAVEAGQLIFGESKVQEAKAKIPLCPGRARWHMIGHLQSNKCRDAVALFDIIEGVDSLGLAEELNRFAEKTAKTLPILIEINVAGEASKFGCKPEALLADLAAINQLSHLEIHGLMTIAPYSPLPERARPVFRKLAELKKECEQRLGAPLPELSMGMSGDFEPAIEEGATIIRIGTALFGARSFARRQEMSNP